MKNLILTIIFLCFCCFSYSQKQPIKVRDFSNNINENLLFQLNESEKKGYLEVLFIAENKSLKDYYLNLFVESINSESNVILIFDFIPPLRNKKGEETLHVNEYFVVENGKQINNSFYLMFYEPEDWLSKDYDANNLRLHMDYY